MIRRILVAGLGSVGQRHVRNLRALMGETIEILAYRARGGGPVLADDGAVIPATTVEERYSIRSFTSLDDALACEPEAAIVANPNSEHLAVARAAVRAGCHLLVEKPLSSGLEGCAELAMEVESRGLAALVGYQFRFHPGLRLVERLVREGAIGRPAWGHLVNAEYLPDWHPWEDYRETHAGRRALGGGALRIQSHEIDLALWLLGTPRRLFAVGGRLGSLEVDVEDCATILMQCGDREPVGVSVHLDYLQRPPQRVVEIAGDEGRLRFDYYANEVVHHDLGTRASRTQRFEGFERNEMFLAEMRHFLACIEGMEKPVCDLREGMRSLAVSIAAEESMRGGAAVEVPRE